MGCCFQNGKNEHRWGDSRQNEKGEGNNNNNNDNNYIMKKREEYFQSNEFKKKSIFNNQ